MYIFYNLKLYSINYYKKNNNFYTLIKQILCIYYLFVWRIDKLLNIIINTLPYKNKFSKLSKSSKFK